MAASRALGMEPLVEVDGYPNPNPSPDPNPNQVATEGEMTVALEAKA